MPGYRWLLARTANNLGVLLEAVKQHAEAETVLRRALALQEELVASFPHIPTYRQELASIHNNLGLLLMHTGTAQAAEGSLHRAIQLREGLVADFPEMPDYRQNSRSLGTTSGSCSENRSAEGREGLPRRPGGPREAERRPSPACPSTSSRWDKASTAWASSWYDGVSWPRLTRP